MTEKKLSNSLTPKLFNSQTENMPDTKTRVLLIDDDEDDFIITRDTIEDIPGRTKVGNQLATYQSYVYDRSRDSIYAISMKDIPGIKDLPDYFFTMERSSLNGPPGTVQFSG